jgi:Tetratricopeptide repeat
MQACCHKITYAVIIFCFITMAVTAQPASETLIDSILKSAIADTAKVKFLLDKSHSIIYTDSVGSMQLARAGMELAKKTGNDVWIANAYCRIASVYFLHKDYFAGSAYYEKALKISIEKFPAISGKVYTAYAWAYNKQGLFNKSVEYYQKALDATERSGDKSKEAGILNAMGNLFFYNNQIHDCIRYKKHALEVAVNAKSKLAQMIALEGLVVSYISLYKKEYSLASYIDSGFYYSKAAEQLLSTDFNMEGNNHLEPVLLLYTGELLFFRKDYYRAIEKILLAIEKARPLKEEDVLSKSYLLMSRIYYAQRKFTEAASYQQLGLGILSGSTDAVVLKEGYEQMILLLLEKRDSASAFVYQGKWSRLNDSVFTQEKARAVNALQIEYETAEKEFAIKDLKKTNRFIVVTSVLGLGVLLLVLRSYRLRRKLLLQQQRILQEENQKMTLENKVKEEANEKLRLSQQLEQEENLRKQQEYENQLTLNQLNQEQLQQQIDFKYRELTSQMVQMEKRNEVLLQIKSELQEVASKNGDAVHSKLKSTLKVIDQNLAPDDDFESFRLHFENVHPHFFVQLIEKTNNQLSQLDIKHCAYIKMNFGTKEIANLLNVEPKSIRMARYRLKQKLKLEKETDLVNFINSL